ncbi:hypothetical protein Q0812_03190 [Brevundimonas sp. 2R-24]|uniref:SWFGD domain-containing protein n=1 Tax=Peiella sedimenti TaxID=3061083 RepID=A0ABT8SIM4_9CAUL|nr:hypothetical protein [Caulobacteraceae bacterium XZ-24]
MENRYENRERWAGGRDRQDDRWEARDRTRDEGRSWSQTEAEGRQPDAYGYDARQDYGAQDYRGASYDQYGYGAHPSRTAAYGDQRGYYAGGSDYARPEAYERGRTYATREPRGGEFGRDYGVTRAYGQSYERGYAGGPNYERQAYANREYPRHGYAPGGQIWEGSSARQRDYEPDYLHWREQQMSKFDRDYHEWRSERRQKFSSDFDTWRASRGNQVVENVSDGGVGSQKDIHEAREEQKTRMEKDRK